MRLPDGSIHLFCLSVPCTALHCTALPPPACLLPACLLPARRFDRKPEPIQGLTLPAGTTAAAALDRVLRLPGVGSKRFLTTKVDRSVTGLIAQQQCCGPLQLPVSDVAVMAQSHFGHTGSATSIGEQPLKVGRWVLLGTAGKPAALPPRLPSVCPCPSARAWVPPKPGLPAVPATPHIPSFYLPPPPLLQGLIDPKAMARLALGEALTNLVFARVTALRDIKASGEPAPELPLPVPAPAACLHAWRLRVCYMPPCPACMCSPAHRPCPACLPTLPSLPCTAIALPAYCLVLLQ